MVERARPVVWDVLEEVIAEHPVLLNRAPTLHRLGIQAFEPQLVEGKAIQIHPLVCTAFNADFDGDQMAVHLPLSAEAQAEARILMLSSNNILSPAHGRPITSPTQDMVLGIYYLTATREDGRRGPRLRLGGRGDHGPRPAPAGPAGADHRAARRRVPPRRLDAPEGYEPGAPITLTTTLGRACSTRRCRRTTRSSTSRSTRRSSRRSSTTWPSATRRSQVAATLDALKAAGFHWATRSGVTISIEDVVTPQAKQDILERHEARAEKVQSQYERGLITDDERRQELINIWTEATNEVAKAMEDAFPQANPVFMMVHSGARGNWMQVRQIAGMRGLVANPKGEIIPRPIKANFREGLSVLEYFISTHGARKGLADTALRTADSGYLTRRLVDVSQDVIIREEDCGTDRGLVMPIAERTPRRQAGPARQRRHQRLLPQPGRGRRRQRQDRRRGRQRHRRRAHRRADRRRRQRGPGPHCADLREQGRHLCHLLRPLARDRQARRRRRGGRHHRRAVHRRARHPADDADVPHRRRRG